jgi:hypothetical protein
MSTAAATMSIYHTRNTTASRWKMDRKWCVGHVVTMSITLEKNGHKCALILSVMQQPESTIKDKYVLSKEQYNILVDLLHKAQGHTLEVKTTGLGGVHTQQLQQYEVHLPHTPSQSVLLINAGFPIPELLPLSAGCPIPTSVQEDNHLAHSAEVLNLPAAAVGEVHQFLKHHLHVCGHSAGLGQWAPQHWP